MFVGGILSVLIFPHLIDCINYSTNCGGCIDQYKSISRKLECRFCFNQSFPHNVLTSIHFLKIVVQQMEHVLVCQSDRRYIRFCLFTMNNGISYNNIHQILKVSFQKRDIMIVIPVVYCTFSSVNIYLFIFVVWFSFNN